MRGRSPRFYFRGSRRQPAGGGAPFDNFDNVYKHKTDDKDCNSNGVQFVKDFLSYNPRSGRISEAFLKRSRIHAKLKEFCREKTKLINYARGRFGLVEKPPAAP